MSFPHVWNFKAIALVIGTLTILPVVALQGEDLVVRDTTIPTMEGLNCDIPHYVVFPLWLDQMTLTGLSTCLHGNDYNATCLGSYDGGEDYIMQLEVQQAMHAYLRLDTKGTGWAGFAIDNSCPPDNDCLALSTSSGGQPQYINYVFLDVGTYYIMIDTWPSPNCIPEFDLQIVRLFPDPWGVDCNLPLSIIMTPEDLPLTIGPESTTSSEDNYNQTCLGVHDSGEDLLLKFTLPDSLRVNISIDPGGVAGSGFALNLTCPPTSECLAKAADSLGQEYGVRGVSLPAGEFYMMVDTWSMQTPLTQMFIHIEAYYRCGDADGSDVVNISDAVYLISYVFAGGAPPWPPESGDADESGIVTISDAVYLISHIFGGGPAPCDG